MDALCQIRVLIPSEQLPELKYVAKNLLTDYHSEYNTYKTKQYKDFLKGVGRIRIWYE
jgi:hypothetical protein